jgi:hypothetical protein
MENKSRKKRKTETTLSDINKKNRNITIYDDIYKEISGLKYDIYLVKESISEIIKKHISTNLQSGNKNNYKKKDKILNLERIIKDNEIKRDEEMYEIKSEIQEIKEMILSIHLQKVNISEGNIRGTIKDNDMSYIN